jgi:glycosyltransferase involved in cell wall biosynthesis
MSPPFISYITFNRLGLTIGSLSAVLDSPDDFEMHIIDNGSKDDTWDYIMSLSDSRIKTRQHFDINQGKTYALNLQLVRRNPEQYFFHIDGGVLIDTKDWLSRFMAVFEAFPEVGLLGVMAEDGVPPPVLPRNAGTHAYLELTGSMCDAGKSCIPGRLMGLKPDLIDEIGYFCEENYYEDIDLTYRVCHHTNFKAGFVTGVTIRLPQTAVCQACLWQSKCKLGQKNAPCITRYEKYEKTEEFLQKNKWKFDETMRDMQSGARPVYCASLLDGASVKGRVYNKDWAMDNMVYFIRNAN